MDWIFQNKIRHISPGKSQKPDYRKSGRKSSIAELKDMFQTRMEEKNLNTDFLSGLKKQLRPYVKSNEGIAMDYIFTTLQCAPLASDIFECKQILDNWSARHLSPISLRDRHL